MFDSHFVCSNCSPSAFVHFFSHSVYLYVFYAAEYYAIFTVHAFVHSFVNPPCSMTDFSRRSFFPLLSIVCLQLAAPNSSDQLLFVRFC